MFYEEHLNLFVEAVTNLFNQKFYRDYKKNETILKEKLQNGEDMT